MVSSHSRNCAVLLAAAVSAVAIAYPIQPQTLWSLTKESERIVLARVSSHETIPRGSDPFQFNSARAVLEVLETWKGHHEPSMRVAFAPNMACPAPARFELGKTVVAFLARDEGEWQVVALSYGTRYPPTAADIEDHRAGVREIARLQANWFPSDEQRADVLVRLAAKPSTRWDGLYELAAGHGTLLQQYDGARTPLKLNSAQRAILVQGYLDSPTSDQTLLMMVEVLRGHPDPVFDSAITAALDRLFETGAPYWAERTVLLMEERIGGKPPKRADWDATVGGYLSSVGDGADEWRKRVRASWEELKARGKLKPRALKAFVPTSDEEAVGGDTSL